MSIQVYEGDGIPPDGPVTEARFNPIELTVTDEISPNDEDISTFDMEFETGTDAGDQALLGLGILMAHENTGHHVAVDITYDKGKQRYLFDGVILHLRNRHSANRLSISLKMIVPL